jgi:hypothetical protein
MLASKIAKRVEIPHEPGEWMQFRALGGKKLGEARQARSLAQIATLRAMGSDVLSAIKGATVEDADEKPNASPLDEFDVDTLLRSGITAWSYDAKVNPANIDELDEKTRQWAAREIVALCTETEADRGND